MADQKISQLDAKTTLADTDLIPIMDEEATPDQTKKITGAHFRDSLLTGYVDYGLSFEAEVTTYTSATEFASTDLIGKGDGYFIGYYVYVVRDAGGAGAVPQGEWGFISGYTSATGTFTHTAFSAILAVGDKVLIQHPYINSPVALDAVYVDSAHGIAGTSWPIGTPGVPVDNLADAITIATARGIDTFRLVNPTDNLTMPSNMEGYRIIGASRNKSIAQLTIDTKSVSKSYFENLAILGTAVDTGATGITFVNCQVSLETATNSYADFWNCRIFDIDLYSNATIKFFNCYFPEHDDVVLYCDTGINVGIDFNNCSGYLIVRDFDTGNLYFYGSMRVHFEDTCGGGNAWVHPGIVYTKQSETVGTTFFDYSLHTAGRTFGFTENITSAANAGDVTVATVADGTCLIKSVVLRSNGATTADLTSAGIFGGAAKVITFLSAADAVKANLDADDEQVSWTGAVTLKDTKTIVISLVGTGATAVDFDVDIEYEAITDGAYLV